MIATTRPICTVPECPLPHHAYGYCSTHGARWRRTGTTDAPQTPSLRERLLGNLIIDQSGCLLWTGATSDAGYGRITIDGRSREVHIVMWEMFEGPVPDGLPLDHVRKRGCFHRNCASIAHLEPVTNEVNILRGTSPSAINATKERCKCGREYDAVNNRGARICRTCCNEATRRWRTSRVITARREAAS